MYQHLSLRTADVSPRSSLLRDVSRGGLHRSLFLANWIINPSNKSGRAIALPALPPPRSLNDGRKCSR